MGFLSLQVPEDHGEDDSSEKTPSKASKSPQKSTKRPKTIPVKVSLLDGSDYEAAVEVCSHSPALTPNFLLTHPRHMTAAPWQPELSRSHCFHRPIPRSGSAFRCAGNTCCAHCFRWKLRQSVPGGSHQTGTSRLLHSTDATGQRWHKLWLM